MISMYYNFINVENFKYLFAYKTFEYFGVRSISFHRPYVIVVAVCVFVQFSFLSVNLMSQRARRLIGEWFSDRERKKPHKYNTITNNSVWFVVCYFHSHKNECYVTLFFPFCDEAHIPNFSALTKPEDSTKNRTKKNGMETIRSNLSSVRLLRFTFLRKRIRWRKNGTQLLWCRRFFHQAGSRMKKMNTHHTWKCILA